MLQRLQSEWRLGDDDQLLAPRARLQHDHDELCLRDLRGDRGPTQPSTSFILLPSGSVADAYPSEKTLLRWAGFCGFSP